MKRKKHHLKYTKERAIVSDVLPYEVPVTFTNRHFYQYLLQNGIEIDEAGNISWNTSADTSLTDSLTILLSISADQNSPSLNCTGKTEYSIHGTNELNAFTYFINHKENEFRELCIPHPRSQLYLINFYHNYKEIILYYCSISSYSIRHPVRIASSIYFKDKTHFQYVEKEQSKIEEYDREYETARSFFVYEKYSNVYKFYESHKFHRCEKKYNHLKRLDISDCFNSIYSHSLTWATYGKKNVKESINTSKSTFAGMFDKFMQISNSNETNGIIIGPEFSRIFAEILLQSIDSQLEISLSDRFNLTNKVDYEIFRYVDDYFVFFNAHQDCENIEDTLQKLLKVYKLKLNVSKSITYEKPIITEISRAKNRIVDLLNNSIHLQLKIKPLEDEDEIIGGTIYINSKSLITNFKIILKECDVRYPDVLNFTLAIVERRLENVWEQFENIPNDNKPCNDIVNAFLAILDFTFFISSVSPKVNMTIRMCRIIRVIITVLSNKHFGSELRDLAYKNVYDNARFILKKHSKSTFTQVETLYYLIAISELGKDYWLESDALASYFNIYRNIDTDQLESKQNFNYFSFTVLLLYMKDKKRYDELRIFLEKEIVQFLITQTKEKFKSGESALLGLDFTSCPYVSTQSKHKVLKDAFNIPSQMRRENLINRKNKNGKPQQWFTTWFNFDYGEELDAKKSFEVY